ncbi:hypothetical protein TNCV_1827231 [Trichonephila clavipes]|nr:hypothetical protein TNCV_1827231 [Trichonephila clavipes]
MPTSFYKRRRTTFLLCPDSIARPIAFMPLSRMENTNFAMPSIIDSHDMGLRTVYSPDAQKKTPIQRLFLLRRLPPRRASNDWQAPKTLSILLGVSGGACK